MAGNRESVFIVETINWSYGKNKKEVHHNEYYAHDLSAAIALATKIEIAAQEVAEEVVLIRKATLKEAQEFLKVYDHFLNIESPALSEKKARALRSILPK
jgi:DsbC/DsbD-like thiol-disulfide interchange protein